jgi:acetoin utilization deacetylase AcuC-like enzyme
MPMISRRHLIVAGVVAASSMRSLDCSAQNVPRSRRDGTTLLVTHPAFLGHVTYAGNPERPARMTAIDSALSAPSFCFLRREEAPMRSDIERAILRVSSAEHLARVKAAAADVANLPYAFDGDTVMSAGSLEAAYRAVGSGLLAVDHVMDPTSGITNAFCQVRPPGHHAERDRIMGFCLFNNIATAAAHARAAHGVERVAIVDFDVHHGNGTQQIFWSDRDTFYGSTHQMPLFPGTGAVSETGAGNICNAPLRAGDGGEAFREAFQTRISPRLDEFKPDLILISAGFDAHEGDPLAALKLQEADFDWATRRIADIAHRRCGGRIVSFLEGGYVLEDLGRSAATHVAALMDAA